MTNAVLRTRLLRQPHLSNTLIPVAVLGLAALMLSLVASGPGVLPGDVAVTRWVQKAPEGNVGILLQIVNTIGETPVMFAIGAILAYICWRQRRLDATILIAIASFARITNPLLKAIAESPRPTTDRVPVEVIASGWGFPSGHVMGMTLLVGAVGCLAWDNWPQRRARIATISIASLILLLSGAGRIYVAAHWPSDVLGAYLYGGLGVIGLTWCWRNRSKRASISFGRSVADSILTVPDLTTTVWAGRPAQGERSVGTLVWQRRRFSAIAFGSLLALTLVVVATAQTPSTTGEHAARIIAGSCADPNAATSYDLKPLSLTASDDDDDDNDDAPTGTSVGSANAIPVAASGNQLNVDLTTLTTQPHAIVITAGALDAPIIACGDIGGQRRGDDDLIIGLTPVNNSNSAAIAHLDGDDDDQQTDITLYLISWT